MLTDVEKLLFLLLAAFSIGAAYSGFAEMFGHHSTRSGSTATWTGCGGGAAAGAGNLPVSADDAKDSTSVTEPLSLGHRSWASAYYFLVNIVDSGDRLRAGL